MPLEAESRLISAGPSQLQNQRPDAEVVELQKGLTFAAIYFVPQLILAIRATAKYMKNTLVLEFSGNCIFYLIRSSFLCIVLRQCKGSLIFN